jgi:hypothetical protein
LFCVSAIGMILLFFLSIVASLRRMFRGTFLLLFQILFLSRSKDAPALPQAREGSFPPILFGQVPVTSTTDNACTLYDQSVTEPISVSHHHCCSIVVPLRDLKKLCKTVYQFSFKIQSLVYNTVPTNECQRRESQLALVLHRSNWK